MSWIEEDACVGCAECIHCGRRGRTYVYCSCDRCGDVIEGTGYLNSADQLCESCASEVVITEHLREGFTKDEFVDLCRSISDYGYDPNKIVDVYDYFKVPPDQELDTFCADNPPDFDDYD